MFPQKQVYCLMPQHVEKYSIELYNVLYTILS